MMEKKVLEAVERFSLLEGVNDVTVALSGGADSVALLYALYSLRQRLGIRLYAAHFNHRIRGAEADRDEQFVRRICKELGIELFCGSADVPAFARDNKLSLELAARQLRYEFLDNVARGAVATAHTASDSLETVLFNLARGTGLKGLCGIPPRRGRYIRPIILCTREMVEDYCSKNNLEYVTDSTNLCDDYSRNKLRHSAVPVLKEINPNVEAVATRGFLSLLEDSEFLESVASREYKNRKMDVGFSLKDFNDVHPAVAKRVIMLYYGEFFGGVADSLHINGIYGICKNGGRCSLPNDMAAVAEDGRWKIEREGERKLKKHRFLVETRETVNDLFTKGQKINNLLLKNSLDCDKIVGQLVVRTRSAGDSVRLKNKNCTKTLKKLYNEYAIPLNEREDNPVIADEEGIIWINGIGVADRCAAVEDSRRILRIDVHKESIE